MYERCITVKFIITGTILLAGIACFLFLLGKIEQIEAPPAEESGITDTTPGTSVA